MNLYILRHAEAGEAPRDEDRELTERGREQAQAVAAGIVWLNLGLDTILTSPLPRAAQTAQPIAKAIGANLQLADELAAGQDAAAAKVLLPAHGERLMFVGHEPQLSGIIDLIAGGRVHMRKAMLACVEVETTHPPYGELAWLLGWRHLERLGR